MPVYAQTNIQLYNQLISAAWIEADLRMIHAGYQLAATLFAGQVRPNHKVFLSHLVGTASILAAHGGKAEIAAAGLLHSAYSHGEFGDGSRGLTARKREQVRLVVRPTCESLIAGYSSSDFALPKLADRSHSGEQLAPAERDVAFIKLADLLEDHCDLGMAYSPNKRLPSETPSENGWRDKVAQLATALGHPALASELLGAMAATAPIKLPAFLCGTRDASFLIAPLSHRTKSAVRLSRFRGRLRNKFARTMARISERSTELRSLDRQAAA